MSRVLGDTKCRQCGYLEAYLDFDCRTDETEVNCPRCGYSETWEHVAHGQFKNGHIKKGVKTFYYSAGCLWAVQKSGTTAWRSLDEDELDRVAAQVRKDITNGTLSAESHVTKYDFQTKQVIALVGKVPTERDVPHAETSCAGR
jgi:predicted nucleic-acid-binding Zn-ribbon protein